MRLLQWLFVTMFVALLCLTGCTPKQSQSLGTQLSSAPAVTAPADAPAPTPKYDDSVLEDAQQSKAKMTMAQVYSGLKYLNTSLVVITSAMEIVKTQFPDKFTVLHEKVGPVLVQVEHWVSMAMVAYGESDLTKAISLYNLARPQLGTIMEAFKSICGSAISAWLFH